MNSVHFLKTVLAIAIAIAFASANAQDRRFAFKGSSAATSGGGSGGSGGSGASASAPDIRKYVGWTATGTVAQDTVATEYRLDKSAIRLKIADSDGDSIVFFPQSAQPLQLRDGATVIAAIDSLGRAGFGTSTSGQASRAYLNVLARSGSDTLALFIGDRDGAVGDSSITVTSSGQVFIKSAPFTTTDAVYINGRTSSTYFSFGSGNGDLSSISSGQSLVFYGGGAYGGGTTWSIGSGNRTNRGWWFKSESNDTIYTLVGGATNRAYALFGRNTKPYVQTQAFVTIRPNALSDTVLMVRNDANSTIDSTFTVFANGAVSRTDAKHLPAAAWIGTVTSSPTLDTVAYIVGYSFGQTAAETLTVDFELPEKFVRISAINVEVVSPNTAGDSVGFKIAWRSVPENGSLVPAFSTPLSGVVDLGTVANVRKKIAIGGTFSGFAAGDRVILKLWRDTSIANNVAAPVFMSDVRVDGVGLLR